MLLLKSLSVLPTRTMLLKKSIFSVSMLPASLNSSSYALTIDDVATAIGIPSDKIRSIGFDKCFSDRYTIKFKPSFKDYDYIQNGLASILCDNDIEHIYYRYSAPAELHIREEGMTDFIRFVKNGSAPKPSR